MNLDGGASQEQARRVLKENLAESALLRQAKREYRRKRGSLSNPTEETNHHRQITSFFPPKQKRRKFPPSTIKIWAITTVEEKVAEEVNGEVVVVDVLPRDGTEVRR